MTVREMRACSNSNCMRMVMYRKGSHTNKYCSHKCRSTFSPAMQCVCKDNKLANSSEALCDLIREMKSEGKNNLDIAVIFGVGTKTLRLWCQKLGV